MPEAIELNKINKTYLDVLNWLENKYENKVYVLDINFAQHGSSLYGEQHHLDDFRKELDSIMATVYEQVEPWEDC